LKRRTDKRLSGRTSEVCRLRKSLFRKGLNMDENNEQEYVKIAILESIVEAQIIGSILEEEDIPFMIRSYHDTAYNGLYQFQKGWGELSAPAACQEDILRILDDVRSDSYDTEDDDDFDEEYLDEEAYDDYGEYDDDEDEDETDDFSGDEDRG